jgi:hypothetical protein
VNAKCCAFPSNWGVVEAAGTVTLASPKKTHAVAGSMRLPPNVFFKINS